MEKISSDKYKLSPLSKEAASFEPGVYEHYKGSKYKTICVARDSEDKDKELVIYQSLDKKNIWARPIKMFLENVKVGGKPVPRFKYIGPKI